MVKFAQIRGFLIDLDGVILDAASLDLKAWHQLATSLQLPWDDKLEVQLKGRSRFDTLGVILDYSGEADQFDAVAEAFLVNHQNERFLKLVANLTPADTLPGIKTFLAELKTNGFLLALASASKNVPVVLDRLELSQYFPNRICPDMFIQERPNPEIYLKASASIGSAPADCIGVSYAAAGIEAINAAGALSVGIGDRRILKEAALVVPSTRELTLANLRAQLS